jgi:hypothetical protein
MPASQRKPRVVFAEPHLSNPITKFNKEEQMKRCTREQMESARKQKTEGHEILFSRTSLKVALGKSLTPSTTSQYFINIEMIVLNK